MDRHNPTNVASAQMQNAMNVAGRMGGWSASHWKTAVFGWLAFVVVPLAAGMVVGTKQIETKDANVGQAHRADRILQKAFPQADPQTEIVLVQNSKLTARDAEFRAAIADVLGSMRGNPAIKNLVSPYDRGQAALISQDGHTAMVQWDMRGEKKAAEKKIDAILAHHQDRCRPTSDVHDRRGRLGQLGQGARQALHRPARARRRALDPDHDHRALPRARFARGGRRAIAAGALGRPRHDRPARDSEPADPDGPERQRGRPVDRACGRRRLLTLLHQARAGGTGGRAVPEAALAAAAATSGRSVLISGFTVLIAMAGRFFAGDKTYLSFAIGTMTVVGIAMLGSLTVLPALLVEAGRRHQTGDGFRSCTASAVTAATTASGRTILTPALRHPLISAVCATTLLIPDRAPGPAPSSRAARPRLAAEERRHRRHDPWPSRLRSRTAMSIRQLVAIEGDVSCTGREARTRGSAGEGAGERRDDEPIEVEDERLHKPSRGSTIPLAGKGVDAKSERRATRCATSAPGHVGRLPGADYAVTGGTAISEDQNALLKTRRRSCSASSCLRLPAPARLVPLHRGRAEGDPAQPALGRRGLRRPLAVFQ